MIIRKRAFPRAGLVGNPSDGYNGKTISFTFTNFSAEVVLYETPELEILPNTRDHSRFRSVRDLVKDVGLFGYYGGIRLLKAAIKRFFEYCAGQGIDLDERNFTIRYSSDIPHMVGLAGSSAIITACFRAMMAFYGIRIPKPMLANLVLAVEKDELGIAAGLQDRVAQVYQGLVYMDFDKAIMQKQGYGRYEELDPKLLPPLYIAYRSALSQSSEMVHNNLRARFERGDPEVVDAICFWAQLTDQVKAKLAACEGNQIGELLDANFDRRASICEISQGNLSMVRAARSRGGSATFTGSGGAIVGTYGTEADFAAIKSGLESMDIAVLKPSYAPATGEGEL
jgi:glucuronokinase